MVLFNIKNLRDIIIFLHIFYDKLVKLLLPYNTWFSIHLTLKYTQIIVKLQSNSSKQVRWQNRFKQPLTNKFIDIFFQYTLFRRTIFKEHKARFAQNLRTILALAEEQSLKFSIKAVNKRAARATQLSKCILLHAYLYTVQLKLPAARAQTKTSYS